MSQSETNTPETRSSEHGPNSSKDEQYSQLLDSAARGPPQSSSSVSVSNISLPEVMAEPLLQVQHEVEDYQRLDDVALSTYDVEKETMTGLPVDFVVKLGGSAITDKSGFETINQKTLDEAANVLARCYNEGLRFVVLHGAGSFGHRVAKEHDVSKGFKKCPSIEKRKRIKFGFAATRLSVTKLNHLVISALVRLGVPAVTYAVFGTWRMNNGAVVVNGMDSIQHGLEQGFVPVLFGDCVFDDTKGCTILSSDITIKHLSDRLRPRRAVFLMDCAGVFTLPPNLPGSSLISDIHVSKDGGMLNGPTLTYTNASRAVADVTGGIELKIDKACQIVCSSGGRTPVLLCSTASDAFLNACLFGEFGDTRGTRISYRDDELRSEERGSAKT